MGLAGNEVKQGKMTVGDFVLVQVFILQLYAPLGFLGTYWRHERLRHWPTTRHRAYTLTPSPPR